MHSHRVEVAHPMVVGSIAILPPMITAEIARAKNTTRTDICGVLGRRPRLNFRRRTAKGKSVITNSQTRENLCRGMRYMCLNGAKVATPHFGHDS